MYMIKWSINRYSLSENTVQLWLHKNLQSYYYAHRYLLGFWVKFFGVKLSTRKSRTGTLHTVIFFEILPNQTEIRLYLPFFNWFETKRICVWFQINRKMETTIGFRVDLIRFRKDLSECIWLVSFITSSNAQIKNLLRILLIGN